jgi:hypothetical protein
MVSEIVVVEIISERVLEFEAAIERPNVYTFIIHWNKLEDHTETFRKSDSFAKWREIIGPFFAHPPVVEHWSHLFNVNN